MARMKSKYLKNQYPDNDIINTETVEIGTIYDDLALHRKYFVTDIVVDDLGLKWVKCYDMQNPNNPDDNGLWPLKACMKSWRKIQ